VSKSVSKCVHDVSIRLPRGIKVSNEAHGLDARLADCSTRSWNRIAGRSSLELSRSSSSETAEMWMLRNDDDLADVLHDQQRHDLGIGDDRDDQKRSRAVTACVRHVALASAGC